MKSVGAFLLILGLVGLALVLIFWLPAEFSPVLVAVISVLCLVAVWGGGKLAQPKLIMIPPQGLYTQAVQPTQVSQPAAASCPGCGSQVIPGQQFCGSCGSSLSSYCARCGSAIKEPSRFCGKCGARLS